MKALRYQFFPRSVGITEEIRSVIKCFEAVYGQINSSSYQLSSNEVLQILSDGFQRLSYQVETSKKTEDKIQVPVLFGNNNKIDKSFYADAVSADGKIVIEIEAGRAVDNHQFLKDIFQASMMHGVEYLLVAVRNEYRKSDDFSKICTFLETLYLSNRIILPLKGIVIVGY